jgi:hypothetical protein
VSVPDSTGTAYVEKDFGPRAGWGGPVYLRGYLSLPRGQEPPKTVSVLELRDTTGAVVYELLVGHDRTLRLWSPENGFRRNPLRARSGVAVPNDGTSALEFEVRVVRSESIELRVDGKSVLTYTGRHSPTLGVDTLRVGIDGYDRAATSPFRVVLDGIGLSQKGWLGDLGTRLAPAGAPDPAPVDPPADASASTPEPTPAAEPASASDSAPEAEPVDPPPAPTPAPAPAPTPDASVNLLPNPGFETDPAADYETSGPAAFSWAADAFYEGAWSLKLVSNGDTASRLLSKRKSLAAVPGATYEAQAYLTTSALAGPATLVLTFWTSNGQVSTQSADLSGTTGWTPLSVSATAPADARFVGVEIRVKGVGTVWTDALRLGQV